MAKINPTPEERKDFVVNVNYEASMMKSAAQKLIQAQILQNIALESFLIHARNLYSFFTKTEENRHPEESIANHYNGSWEKPEMKYLDEHIKEIHQFLAHLSYERERKVKESGKKDWSIKEIIDDIRVTWNSFQANLPEELRKNFPEWDKL